jgi:DNA-binding PadR family transcriptional regulator
MLSEFASGIDIINRLLKMGLCEEFPDENDKRAKRVRITPDGMEALQEASPIMAQISKIAFNELTETEKKMIAHILRRADRFHSEHYADFRSQNFDSIYEKVIPSVS